MALTYDGSNGIFTRLGKLAGLMDAVRTHQDDMYTRLKAIQAEYNDDDFHMISGLVAQIESRIEQSGGVLLDVRQAAINTVIETSYNDSLVSTRQVMPSKSIDQALLYLAREMALDSETVDRTTISKGSVAAGASNTGNGTLLFTELVPLSASAGGTQYPHIRTERIEVRCVQDAQDSAIRGGEERFEARGRVPQPNLDRRFPAGSGTRLLLSSVHAAVDAGARYENQLRNGSFEAFTSNLPDGWSAVTGTAATHFGETSSPVYRGSKALKFIGDGSTLTKLRQQLGTSDGTPATIVADRLYVLTCVARVNAGASAGVLRISLENAAGTEVAGTGTTQSYTVGTSFTRISVPFRAPLSLPSTVYAVVELTTALNAGGEWYIDEFVLAEVQQIAPGGTGLIVLSGSTNWVVNDTLTLDATNNGEGAFNTAFDRLFDMYSKGIVLPNSTTPSISDTLIS